jgi:S-adenosyl methyltransferase
MVRGRPQTLKRIEMTSEEAPAPPNGGDTADWAGPPFDTSVAHQARAYDYLLGGKDNYAADRAAAEAMLKIYPEMAFAVRANRAFLGRAVRYLAAEAGMRQFLDIGTGIPTADNTHQVAQAIAPESISHPASDLLGRETVDDLTVVSDRMMRQEIACRGREQVARFFDRTDLVAPGLVRAEEWRPDPDSTDAGTSALWCAVGRSAEARKAPR